MTDRPPFEIDTDTSDPAFTVVSVGGEVDISTSDDFAARLTAAKAPGVPVVVDLSKVAFMDSSGLRCIHEAALDAAIVLVVPSTSVIARTARITGLDDIVPICDDLERARQQLRPPSH